MRGQSFYDWCMENGRESLLSEWEYNKNYPLTPYNCARGTSKKVWWKCEKGHEWQAGVIKVVHIAERGKLKIEKYEDRR